MDREARLIEQFSRWEERGRGWAVWPYPVDLEPPFRPFFGHYVPPDTGPAHDDTRRAPSKIGAFLERWAQGTPAAPPASVSIAFLEDLLPEPVPEPASTAPYVELSVTLPPDAAVARDTAEALLIAAASCHAPVVFEVIGNAERIIVQFAATEYDAPLLRDQLTAFFPAILVREGTGALANAWQTAHGRERLVVEFGLARAFMVPLECPRHFDPDPLLALTAALADLRAGEVGVLQVLLGAARAPWAESALRAVTNSEGKPFFADGADLVKRTRAKIASPLFASVIRVGVRSITPDRMWQLARGVVGALAPLGSPSGNDLVPLDPGETNPEADLLARQTHRSGMLLSAEELASLVHVPDASVRSAKLVRDAEVTRAVPKHLTDAHGVVLGENIHRGVQQTVRLGVNERLRHMHVIGVSGTGKSTLLLHLALQDIDAGRGVAVIDPHGDLIDDLLARIPASRTDDVIVLDPTDAEAPVGFNVLHAHSEIEKILLSSDLTALFKRFSTSWGDKMHAVLANAIQAFLERPGGGSLLDLRRFLVDKAFRDEILSTVDDPPTVEFWQKEYPRLTGRPEDPIVIRLDSFLRPKILRAIVAERDSRLDIRAVVDTGKILLVRLAKGEIGEENAALLGSLLVSKFHQVALSRQNIRSEERTPYFLFIDEFHDVVTPSMASLLTGARKYRLGLTLAHQELRQLKDKAPDVAAAVLANAGTRVCFRVGEDDAAELERGFANFTAQHLGNLAVGEAFCRVDRADADFTLRTARMEPVLPEAANATRARVIAHSRAQYGRRPLPQVPPSPAPVSSTPAPEPPPSHRAPAPVSVPPSGPIVASPPTHATTPVPARERKIKGVLKPQEPAPLGRGGPQHKYLQQLVKKWAEGRGYLATIEKEIPGGIGSVDVALEKDGGRIACEISVTTTAEHECANLRKCLAAGFDQVVCLSLEKPFLASVRAMLLPTLREADQARVLFLTPEELFSALDGTNEAEKPGGTVKGYKVNVNFHPSQGASGQVGSKAISKVLARSLSRLKPPT